MTNSSNTNNSNTVDATSPDKVLSFWFGDIVDGWSPPGQEKLWFGFNANDDRRIIDDFGKAVQQAFAGELTHWLATPEKQLAYIILLDQMTRSIYRGHAEAFSGDAMALAASKNGIAKNADKKLAPIQRMFFYMPLEHSEQLADQDECKRLFHALSDEFPSDTFSGAVQAAEEHCKIIQQFGRFPHRNAALGRESTAAEIEFLQTHGGFGQQSKS